MKRGCYLYITGGLFQETSGQIFKKVHAFYYSAEPGLCHGSTSAAFRCLLELND